MSEFIQITDSGKVWVKGSFGPAHAVLVGETVVLTGLEKGQSFDAFVEENVLYLDMIDDTQKIRIARKVCLDATPDVAGTLFSGFEKTKHKDILAINYKTATEEEWREEGRGMRKRFL